MGNAAMTNLQGYQCPVRNCPKKNNRLFSPKGLTMHMLSCHPGEFEKRLKLVKIRKSK